MLSLFSDHSALLMDDVHHVADDFTQQQLFVANQITTLSLLQEKGCRWTYLQSVLCVQRSKQEAKKDECITSTLGTSAYRLFLNTVAGGSISSCYTYTKTRPLNLEVNFFVF